jgi:hypothetical protein
VIAKWEKMQNDDHGQSHYMLHLERKSGASAGSEAGVRVANLNGLRVGRKISIDLRDGSYCTEAAPKLVISRTDGIQHELSCAQAA